MKSKKILVMKTRPGISDQEIRSMMDFDKVLDVHRSVKKKTKVWLTTGVIGGCLIVLLISWQLVRSPEQKQAFTEQPQPQIMPDSTSNEAEVKTEPAEEPVAKTTEKPEETKTPATVTEKDPKGETEGEAAPVYTEAEPLNGYPDLYAYFQEELQYPVEAVKDSIEGIVTVSFVITKDGKLGQIKILNSLGKAFDEEALRVITGMPAWKAASLNGKPVPARLSIPLTFQITKNER